MDDEIIYSWCFNLVECFDSTSSIVIISLTKTVESLSSFRSQYIGVKTPKVDSGYSLEKEFTGSICMNPLMVLCQTINQVD